MTVECVSIPVQGMNANDVTKALKRTKGVFAVDIDLAENLATVTFDDGETSKDLVQQAVEQFRQ